MLKQNIGRRDSPAGQLVDGVQEVEEEVDRASGHPLGRQRNALPCAPLRPAPGRRWHEFRRNDPGLCNEYRGLDMPSLGLVVMHSAPAMECFFSVFL